MYILDVIVNFFFCGTNFLLPVFLKEKSSEIFFREITISLAVDGVREQTPTPATAHPHTCTPTLTCKGMHF